LRNYKIDLTGQRFGRLVAVSIAGTGEKRLWLCKCDCGNNKAYPTFQLRAGYTTSCGCWRSDKHSLAGRRFGLLIVIKRVSNLRPGCPRWECRCDCGNTKVKSSKTLNSGESTHCGCQAHERRSKPRRGVFGESLRNTVIHSYKNNAKRKGLLFDITVPKLIELITGKCFYCGQEPSKTIVKKKFYGSFTYNGIDRLDSNKGYIPNNVVSCCEACNYMKSNHPVDEFLKIIKRIAINRLEMKDG